MLKKWSLCFFLFSILISAEASWAGKAQCDLEFKKLKLCGSIHWVKAPKVVEMITPKDAAEMSVVLKPIRPPKAGWTKELELSVRPTMPSMGGHGTEPTRVSRIHPESTSSEVQADFLVADVFLSMEGEWKFDFKLKKNGKVVDQAAWVFVLK